MSGERSGSDARLESVAFVLLAAVAVVLVVRQMVLLHVPQVDDAGISLAFGQTALRGHGFRLTPYSPIVEGFSNPLWTLIASAVVEITGHFQAGPRAIGQLLAVLAAILTCAWGPLSQGRAFRVEDAAPLVLSIPITAFVYWAGAGLETGLHAFLLAAAGAATLAEQRKGTGALSGVFLGLLLLTRPEAPLYLVAFALSWLMYKKGRVTKQMLAVAAILLTIGGAYAAFRWFYFADVVPNTYYAKVSGAPGRVGIYFRTYVDEFQSIVITCAVGLALSLLSPRVRGRHGVLGALVVAAGSAFILKAGGDWMRDWRFIAPIVPFCGACAASGIGVLRSHATGASQRAFATSLGIAAICAVAGYELGDSTLRWYDLRARPELPTREIADRGTLIGARLRTLGMVSPRIGFPDVGGLGVFVRTANIVDTGMLASYPLAQYIHGNARAAEDYLVSEGYPTAVDVHGPSGSLARLHRFMSHYEAMSRIEPTLAGQTFWLYRGLTPTRDPRCPGGVDRVARMTPDALRANLAQAITAGDPMTALQLYRCAAEHRGPSALPAPEARSALIAQALAASTANEATRLELALRYASLATVMADEDPHLRRRTEALRQRFLPENAP